MLDAASTELYPERERARPLHAPRLVPDDVDLAFFCDDGAPVTCDDVDLGEELASECVYAQGDPINLRDPWGLTTKDKGVKQDCKPYGGGGAGSTVCKDVEEKPTAAAEAEPTDADGCVLGPPGASCRNTARVARNNERWNEEQAARGEATAARRLPPTDQGAVDDEPGVLDRLAETWSTFIEGISPGWNLVDLSRGMHRHIPPATGARPGMGEQEILARAHEATEGFVTSTAPIPGEGAVLGVAARIGGRAATKAVNLPSWRNLTVDIAHIADRHMPSGSSTAGRTLFTGMSEKGVLRAIREAYGSATKVGVQGAERVLLQGEGAGMKIEMWLNTSTNTIETAYPFVGMGLP